MKPGPLAVLVALTIVLVWPLVVEAIPVPVPVHFGFANWALLLPKVTENAPLTGSEHMPILQNGVLVNVTTQQVANGPNIPAPPTTACGASEFDFSQSCNVRILLGMF